MKTFLEGLPFAALLALPGWIFVLFRAALSWRKIDAKARATLGTRCAAFIVLSFVACAALASFRGLLALPPEAEIAIALASAAAVLWAATLPSASRR